MTPFTWSRATIPSHSAQNISAWPITSIYTPAVTPTGHTNDTVRTDHSKLYVWPEIDTGPEPGWGVINASIWAALPMPDGMWRVGTFDQLRLGQREKGMEPFYGKPYALDFDESYQVRTGDPIGYLVSTPARFDPRTVNERSGLVIVEYRTGAVLWREDAAILPPVDPDDPTPPIVPPTPPGTVELTKRVEALEAWARGFR